MKPGVYDNKAVHADHSSSDVRTTGHETPKPAYDPGTEQLPGHVRDLASRPAFERHKGRHKEQHSHNLATSETDFLLDDQGMTGAHEHDEIVHGNSHPHQQHSVGYVGKSVGEGVDPRHVGPRIKASGYENHGIEGFHVVHPLRDKAPEHHPPKGRVVTHSEEAAAHDYDSGPTTQRIF